MKKVNFLGWECRVVRAQYTNGRPALQLVDAETGEPVATATVNLPDVPLDAGETFIKDYSENTGILDVLVKAGVVSAAYGEVATGWVKAHRVTVLEGAV